jgi:hypothetical protein
MLKSRAISWRGLGRDTGASEIAEFAMILPLFFMMLLAVFWFGQAFRIYGTLTHAARQGARAAVAPICATCTVANNPSTNAWNAVQNAMNSAHLNPNQLQWPTVLPPVCACVTGSSNTNCNGIGGNASPVSCDNGQANVCVQGDSGPAVVLSSPGTGGVGECGISVSFQYPYKFWLPLSSLGNQTVYLRAQAQMRLETQ